VVEVADNNGGIRKQAFIKQMIPAKCTGEVSPSEVKVVIEIEDVATAVKGDKEPVPVVRPPVDLGVHIVEMHEVTLARHPQECVDIRSACRHNKRTLVPDNGPFNGYSAGQRTDS